MRVARLVDQTLGALARQVNEGELRPDRQWEAQSLAWAQWLLLFRHVEGIVALAKDGLEHLPGAETLARASLEISLRIQWLLQPEDPYDREARWLAILKNEEDQFLGNLPKVLGEDSVQGRRAVEEQHGLREFRQGVEAKLPAGHAVERLPNLFNMAEAVGRRELYSWYMYLSQSAHGTSNAVRRHYLANLGTHKTWAGNIEPRAWWMVLAPAWGALLRGTRALGRAIPGHITLTERYVTSTQNALDQLAGKIRPNSEDPTGGEGSDGH